MWFVMACVRVHPLLLNVFVCFVRDVLGDVVQFVFLCVLSVFVCLFVLSVFVRFACDV